MKTVTNNEFEREHLNRLIVGLGATGLSTARFFKNQGLNFSAFDQVKPDQDHHFWKAIEGLVDRKDLFFGDDPGHVIGEADLIYLSPGIAPSADWLTRSMRSDAKVTGDLDLFAAAARAPVIAITGSNGKSTVTTLVGDILASAGYHVAVGGNLGTPMLDLLSDDVEIYVLELSSFQLERSNGLQGHIACLLNISSDHLDRHGTVEAYSQVKHRIFDGASAIVFCRQDLRTIPRGLQEWQSDEAVNVCSFGTDYPGEQEFGMKYADGVLQAYFGDELLFTSEEVHLLGVHNFSNLIASCAIVHSLGVSMDVAVDVCRSFRGLAHRCQKIADLQGVSYINDSKATNVGSSIAAISGLRGLSAHSKKIFLIAGGVHKGAEFDDLADFCSELPVTFVLIGEAAPRIRNAIAGRNQVLTAASMDEAVKLSYAKASAGDTVLLSPACASFDMYNSFVDRGDAFVSAVADLIESVSAINPDAGYGSDRNV